MDNSLILQGLYSKEKELLQQLEAVRTTIQIYSGTTSIPVTNKHIEKKEEPPKKEEKQQVRVRNSKEDVKGIMIQMLEEINAPCSSKLVTVRLSQLDINYQKLTVELYLRELEKDGKIIKTGPSTFAHLNWVAPKPATQKVRTIVDVLDYFKLRKEVTRQELISLFVKGGRFNENRLQGRLDKLITEGVIRRLEPGVYKLVEKPKAQ